MKAIFRRSFERDLKRIKDRSVLEQAKQVIEETEAAAKLHEVTGAKKLSGEGSFFRIGVGEYRIGMAVVGSEVEFVRCLHRREIYRRFP